ncbi:MAG: TRAP transporter large permease [Candidatus Adiutrix sp.]|jgi:tripartite ATP-independent transporter DctM subunit|nr:TRAP transporter large permease [Candidatus Adiutrix sp.]
MSPEIFLIVSLGALLICLLMGLEIAWSVGLVALCGLVYLGQPLEQVASTVWTSTNSFTMTAMPMFIFMGCLLGNTRVNDYLFIAVDRWAGRLPGGLVISVILGNAAFSAMCGSSIAAVATFGKVAFPAMESRNYNPSYALGSIAASSVLAPVFPPSILLIIYGSWQGLDIVRLLACGIVPGLLLTILFVLVAILRVKINPKLAPTPISYTMGEKLQSLYRVAPFALLIAMVIIAIFGGYMTPTEAGALGAFLSIVLTILYKRLNFQRFQQSLLDTLKVTSFSLFIMAMASLMSHVFNATGVILLVKDVVLGLELNRYVILLGILVMYLIMGCFFDSWSMLFLTFPFVMPIMNSLGFDPFWWGIVYVLAAEQSTITPPFGLALFVLRGMVPKYPVSTIVFGALPYLAAIYLLIGVLVVFPDIVDWLPALLLN